MSVRRPPRLHPSAYIGPGRYFLTIRACSGRRPFVPGPDVDALVAQLLRTATAEGFAVLAFCVMPDHLHLLVESTRDQSDVCRFVKSFKQQTGFEFGRRTGGRLWQDGYFDRVLRHDEDVRTVAAYIWGNPVRAGIVEDFREWPLSGSQVYRIADFTGDELAARGPEGPRLRRV